MQPLGRNGIVSLVLLALLLSLGAADAQEAVYSEDDVKAAFLYHFATYVEWPAPADDAITIAVLGAAPVAAQLETFLPGRTIQGRAVTVRPLTEIGEIEDDDLLFIGAEHNSRLRELIEPLRQRPILIVTDAEDGLDQGGMVNFQIVDQRLRFEISLPAAERAGLRLSSRLLSAAIRVETVDCRFGCHDEAAPRDFARILQSERPRLIALGSTIRARTGSDGALQA